MPNRIERLKADVARAEQANADANAERNAHLQDATDHRLTERQRRVAKGKAEAAERAARKANGEVRMAKARLREAEQAERRNR